MISAKKLLELVDNTAPFLLATDPIAPMNYDPILHGYVEVLKNASTINDKEVLPEAQFELSLAAHFATVGTFVPTDVDDAIRSRLWREVHHEGAFERFWEKTKKFIAWDEAPVSKRFIEIKGLRLSGHQGEKLSVLAAAYAVATRIHSSLASEVKNEIDKIIEIQKQALIDSEGVSARMYLTATTIVAHNLGDLNRVAEEWKIKDFQMADGVFVKASAVNKAIMAAEAHRHLPLRDAKALRLSRVFLLGFGPWLHEWGETLVREGKKIWTERDFRDVILALVQGWKRLNPRSMTACVGYARALVGMSKVFDGGREGLISYLPPVWQKEVREGGLGSLMTVPRVQFEKNFEGKLTSFKI